MEEINNKLKATINKLSVENNDLWEKINLKDKDVAAKDNYLQEKLREVSDKQKERLVHKDKKWHKHQEEIEEEMRKRCEIWEDKILLIEVALKDYDLKLRWMEDGLYLSELLDEERLLSDDEDDDY